MEKREFVKETSSLLKSAGFKRHGGTFVQNLENGVNVLVWIHRSFFENGYYIEFGFSFNSLDMHSMRFARQDYYKMDLRCGRMPFSFGRANEIYFSEVIAEPFVKELKKNVENILLCAREGNEAIAQKYILTEPVSRAVVKDKKVAEFLGVADYKGIRYAN